MEPCSKLHMVAATSIFNLLDNCPDGNIEKLGLDNDLAVQLSKLNLTEQRIILEKASKFLSLEFNRDELNQQLLKLEGRKTTKDLEDQFLLLGAPNKMMRKLFDMHTNEFCQRRKILNVSGGQNRKEDCNKESKLMIHKLWKEYEDLDEITRYLKICNITNISLNAIWQTITAIHIN